MDKLFDLILGVLSEKGLLVKKDTSVDATIIESTNRPFPMPIRRIPLALIGTIARQVGLHQCLLPLHTDGRKLNNY